MTPLDQYSFLKLSFIDDRIDNVLSNFKAWLTESNEKFTVEVKNEIDFELIRKASEYDSDDFKFMLFEPVTNPNKTVFFASLGDGWYTAVYNYARLFKKSIYQIGITLNKDKRNNPAYFFYYFKPDENNEVVQRAVHLIKEDNRWVFYENSETTKPLKIETPEKYLEKRKADRLNKETILDYMMKAGYDIMNPSFFKTSKPVYYCKWY